MTERKLVRDRIPAIIAADGREPVVKQLEGGALLDALYDKLSEEHAELLEASDDGHRLEELADMAEVIFALAGQYGADEEAFLSLVRRKREERGGFEMGYLWCGEIMPDAD